MSMIGFAARPGTDVEPVCSIASARSPRIERIRASSRAKSAGHDGSYSANAMGPVSGSGSPMTTASISSFDLGMLGFVVPLLPSAGRATVSDPPGKLGPTLVVAWRPPRDGEVA